MGKGTVANLAMTEGRIGDVAGFAMDRGIVNRRGASFPVELILCADRIIRLGVTRTAPEESETAEKVSIGRGAFAGMGSSSECLSTVAFFIQSGTTAGTWNLSLG